ncbi:class I SAM-dependent methyltransferase [Amycolatopsis ultiminotia]|uniref:Class I SAM-dependent methyltransferase n=1 Tax=Amycolatopsis ultiminotia TaxID=543629 RepID=A0ABP6VUT0_9PSEU
MPTLPAERPEPHRHRQIAESFGVDAQRYDRARPRYPDELIAAVLSASPGRDFLDVGCGTGIAARQLRAAGATVLGVEPDARMAGFAGTAGGAGVEVEVATFEDWEPAGRTFDAIVSGQAWHWVDPQAGAAKVQEVLRPGGLFALFWHLFLPPQDIADAFGAAFRQAVPASPIPVPAGRNPGREAFRPVVDKTAAALQGFTGFERHHYDWQCDYTRDEYLDLLPTQGGLTRVPAAGQASVLAAVGEAIDARGGRFTCDYTTVLCTASRT